MNKHLPAVRLLANGGLRRLVRPAILAAAVILVLLAGLFSAAGRMGIGRAQGETKVRCDPASAAGPVGQPLDVDIYVENVVDLFGADVQFSFDTTIAQIVDAEPPEDNGVQIGILDEFLSPDFVLRKIGDNAAGTIWYAVSQICSVVPGEPCSEPVSGSGSLARITFQPLQAGSFTMPITYQKLVQKNGEQIEATPVDCQVTFIVIDPDLSVYLPAAFNVP
jgi:hypothetical protein